MTHFVTLARYTKKIMAIALVALLVMLCAAMVTMAVLWYKLQDGIISYPWLTRYVERRINEHFPQMHSAIASIEIERLSNRRQLHLRVNGVETRAHDNSIAATIPHSDLFLTMGLWSDPQWITGRLSIASPHVTWEPFHEAPSTPTHPSLFSIDGALIQLGIPVQHIQLTEGRLDIVSATQPHRWTIAMLEVHQKTYDGVPLWAGGAAITTPSNHSVALTLHPHPDGSHSEHELLFKDLPSRDIMAILSDRYPGVREWTVGAAVSASIRWGHGIRGLIEEGEVTLTADQLPIGHARYFPTPITLTDHETVFSYQAKTRSIHLAHSRTTFLQKSILELQGLYTWKNQTIQADNSVTLTQFPLKELGLFWPLPIAKEARSWVTSHIPRGIVQEARGHMVMDIDRLTAATTLRTVEYQLPFEELYLTYDSAMMPIEHIKGVARFDKTKLTIEAEHGAMNDTRISNTTITIPYEGPAVMLKGTAKGSVADIMRFVPSDVSELGMPRERLARMTGEAESRVSLRIPLASDTSYADIECDIASHFTNASFPKLIEEWDFSKGDMDVQLQKKKLSIDGKGILHTIPVHFTARLNVETNRYEAPPHVDMMLTHATIDGLFPGKSPIDAGYLEMGIDLYHTGKKHRLTINGDMAHINIAPFNLQKIAGKPFMLEAWVEASDSQFHVPEFAIIKGEAKARGSLMWNRKQRSLTQAVVSEFRWGRNQWTLEWKEEKRRRTVAMNGQSLDMSRWSLWNAVGNGASYSYDATLDLGRVYMANKALLTHLNIYGNSQKNHYLLMMRAHSDNAHRHYFAISHDKDKKHVLLDSDDIGDLLTAFDISTHITEGRSHIILEGPARSDRLEGTITVENFTFTPPKGDNSEPKGASPTPMPMEELHGYIRKEGELWHIEKWESVGPIADIRLHGTIDPAQDSLMIRGTYTPQLHGVNRMLDYIPVLGDMLSGGPGRGIIATKFTIHGPLRNPAVDVNHLSTLVPGFLKELLP